jgi:hypothetical protein
MEIKTLRGLSLRDRLLIVDSDEELARAVEVIRRAARLQHAATICGRHKSISRRPDRLDRADNDVNRTHAVHFTGASDRLKAETRTPFSSNNVMNRPGYCVQSAIYKRRRLRADHYGLVLVSYSEVIGEMVPPD